MTDIKQIADGVVQKVRSFVSKEISLLAAQMDERFKALPAPQKGDSGERGEAGADGLPGKDAEPVDVDGVVREVLKRTIVPLNGKDGEPGAAGKDGERGSDGEKGADGRDGRDGKDGKDGRDGADGQDAFDIDILDAIDETKRYRRGTVASHNGGLWYAGKTTTGMDGWKCIVEGQPEIVIHMSDERTIEVKTISTTGAQKSATFSMPVVLDAGYYREGDAYEKGDGVTFGGSYWIAQSLTRTKPEIGNDEWRLAVKKGRDAKTPASLETPK